MPKVKANCGLPGATVVVLVLMIMSSAVGTAHAGIIEFEFTAEVNVAGEPWASLGIAVGDPVFGSFAYDLNTPDSEADPDFGLYTQSIPNGARVSVGSLSFVSSNYIVGIFDDDLFISDAITILFAGDVTDNGITVLGLNSSPLFSISSSTDVFDGDDLFSQIDLSLFPDRFGGLAAAAPGGSQLQYTITSIERTEVPAPGTALLWLAGVSGLLAVKRQRRR